MTERSSLPCRAAAAWLLLAAVLAVLLGGCGRSTPTCDDAAALVPAGQLGRAAETYALAKERGEGDCAEAGLSTVESRYGDAYVDAVQGRVAEEHRDADAAITAYRAALTLDVENPVAKEALARLQQPAPQLRAPEPVTPAAVAEPQVSLLVVGLLLAGLSGVVAGLLIWLAVRWRRWAREQGERHETSAKAEAELMNRLTAIGDGTSSDAGVRDALSGVERSVTAGTGSVSGVLSDHGRTLTEIRIAVETLQTRLSATRELIDEATRKRVDELEQHLDEVAGALTDAMANGGLPTARRYARPAPAVADGRR